MKNQQQQTKKIQLKNNLEEIYKNISETKQPHQAVKLLAVSKTQPIKTLQKATTLGVKRFGENKVQEAETKAPHLHKDTELHLIGHLQSNKIKKALKIFHVIQTIDTFKLAEKINQQAKAIKKQQRIYCQINIGNDPNKYGFTPKDLKTQSQNINNLSHLKFEGIMTMLPFGITLQETKNLFNKTKRIKDTLSIKLNKKLELSMGMSNDYIAAIKCGATLIRIGTQLFGIRK